MITEKQRRFILGNFSYFSLTASKPQGKEISDYTKWEAIGVIGKMIEMMNKDGSILADAEMSCHECYGDR